MTIISEKYAAEQALLQADPIVIQMAGEIPLNQIDNLYWPAEPGETDRTPRGSFMTTAMRQYHTRGGQHSETIGGVARAILALLVARQEQQA